MREAIVLGKKQMPRALHIILVSAVIGLGYCNAAVAEKDKISKADSQGESPAQKSTSTDTSRSPKTEKPKESKRNPKNILSFTTESGGAGGGIAVNVSKKFLNPKLPLPSQKSLDAISARISRVRVIAGGEINGKPLDKKVLLDSSDKKVLDELIACLKIEEDPKTFGHDMCYGDPTIEIYEANKRVAVLGFHHSRAIRWDKAWRFDGQLKDGRRFAEWFATNGVPGPKKERETALKEIRQSQADIRKWAQSMPDCLQNNWDDVIGDSMPGMLVFTPAPSADDLNQAAVPAKVNPKLTKLMSVLDNAYKDKASKVLALCQWFASGTGKWTGYPSYEQRPGELLLMIPTQQIIDALRKKDITAPELEGAARYFAWHDFRAEKPADFKLLDAEMKKKFLDITQKSKDRDKNSRGQLAFGDGKTTD